MTTRTRILDAALRCFTDRGVTATTIEHLRSASGASTGSIYHHFGSKEGLAGALYVEGLKSYHGAALERIGPGVTGRDGVRAIVEHHLAWVAASPDLARYLLRTRQAEHLPDLEPAIQEANDVFLRGLFRWLRARVDAGQLRAMPLDLYLPLLLGPSHEFARHWLAGRMRTPLQEAAPALAAAAWRSLECTEGGPDD